MSCEDQWLYFSEKICQDSSLTGGKGSSLGKLTELSKDFQNFIVPNGVVITTVAYNLCLQEKVMKLISRLKKVLSKTKIEETKEADQRVMDETQQCFFRSSSTGEDTEQMSAAGQMDTYLGVSLDEIIHAIKKCWASQFSYIAVQYKRQNGQEINSPMAVVVQEMVSCDVAGVLFTCDPLTGNPTSMIITANYGLGESVVSGSEEPDTIEIQRQEDGTLDIKNTIIGSKSHRIILKDEGGTVVEEVSDHKKQVCCLSDTMALRLAQLAVKVSP
ncbi:probable phosphoenolpyruvate synthase [Caerostris extrusa]|uniref:Probable phosphoenolpyruvate synthase n=1 Tax=Caerostris extrusa TaxID=172846 RepID=A0AAV4PGT1_CAEEX|nr:probable phosphoenolpyruvate synthase [Caerostris extrusa]